MIITRMPVSKDRALELIDEKIKQFQHIHDTATHDNRYNKEYHEAFYGTEALLKELFSEEDAKKFRLNTSTVMGARSTCVAVVNLTEDYKMHIMKCISQLEVYKEQIQNFWDEHIINWALIDRKLHPLWNPIKKSWAIIFTILVFLGVVADASSGFIVISGVISNLSNYTKLI